MPPGVGAAALEDFPAVVAEWLSSREDPNARRRREAMQRVWLSEALWIERVADQWREALTAAGVIVA